MPLPLDYEHMACEAERESASTVRTFAVMDLTLQPATPLSLRLVSNQLPSHYECDALSR